jgi:hypothetical protein
MDGKAGSWCFRCIDEFDKDDLFAKNYVLWLFSIASDRYVNTIFFRTS